MSSLRFPQLAPTLFITPSQGLRAVSTAADVDNANLARAAALTRGGDALAAAGDFTAALERLIALEKTR